MDEFLPPEIKWRKDKQGFVNPQEKWLKEDFKKPIEKILNDGMLTVDAGIVNLKRLKQIYSKYCRQNDIGGKILYKNIFNPIALEIWARRFEANLKFS